MASAAVSWPSEVDDVLGGDLTAGLAYLTPAGGGVVTAVAPIGLRDRATGTVGFTTSLAFGRKLERMQRDSRVALAYHAREHGLASSQRFVLVQGDAEIVVEPDQRFLDEVIKPQAERHLGAQRRGRFWDRWLREYYRDHVPVTVRVRRVLSWPDLECRGTAEMHGEPPPEGPPPAQVAPKKGVGPRVDAERAATRCAKLPHRLLAYRALDGYPVAVPVEVGAIGPEGFEVLAAPGLLPTGGRRAGLLAHAYRPRLVGLEARQLTGWLEAGESTAGGGRYAPHTEQGFRAPANKTLLLLANGLLAKRGLREAERSGRIERLRAGAHGSKPDSTA